MTNFQEFSDDVFYTIEEDVSAEIKVKGSTFIAQCLPIVSKENALTLLEQIRAKHYDASHNCFVYRLGEKGLDFRVSDDGEPSGTAGKPILFVIQKFGVSNILLVVTRYFGGTKLGTGGLARAYSDAAEAALQLCTKKPQFITRNVKIFSTYDDTKTIIRLIETYSVSYNAEYHDAIEYYAHIYASKVEEFSAAVTAMTNARAGVVILE